MRVWVWVWVMLLGDLRGGLHLVVKYRTVQRALRLHRERAVPTRRTRLDDARTEPLRRGLLAYDRARKRYRGWVVMHAADQDDIASGLRIAEAKYRLQRAGGGDEDGKKRMDASHHF